VSESQRPQPDPESSAADMAALGVPDQQIADHLAELATQQAARPLFAVWPTNREAVLLFLRVCNLWRYAGMGQIVGLDYAAVKIDLDYAGIAVTPPLWQDLRVMERAAVGALREKN
jgi:hypothetical protein